MDYWHHFTWLFKELKKDTFKLFENLWDNTKEVCGDTFVYLPRNIGRWCKRMWELAPIVWCDYDFDWSRILVYLQFKIKKTREHVAECQRHLYWKRDVKDMKKAEDMIGAVLEDDFCKEEYKEFHKKWGKTHMVSCPTENKHASYCHITHSKVGFDHEKEKAAGKDFKKLMNLDRRRQKAAWDKLWSHLNKNLRSWWD